MHRPSNKTTAATLTAAQHHSVAEKDHVCFFTQLFEFLSSGWSEVKVFIPRTFWGAKAQSYSVLVISYTLKIL